MSVFARFAPRLQDAIVRVLGWSSLRPVQEEAGEALLAGKNAVILAPTAGGKTEASMFPTLSQMVEDGPSGVGALYIAPIKALLNNQADRLGKYTEMVGLRRFVWHGDVKQGERNGFLREPADLLMTTPESLEVMLISKKVDAEALFADLRIVIIDEVHAVAGTDRGAHLMSVLERIAQLSRHDLQRVGLSATVGNPKTILTWLKGSSEREGTVVDPPKARAKRELLVLQRPSLDALSSDAAEMAKGRKSLFFCQSRSVTEAVAGHMERRGTTVFVHHSAISHELRAEAEKRFNHGSDACIVCTSTLELGIDVGNLDRVLQANTPDTVSSFLQRMGRTGRRAGQAANTTFLCENREGVLQAIALIELARHGWVEHVAVLERCWPVLVHQIFALALAKSGVTREEVWETVSRAPDFRGFERQEVDALLDWLVEQDALALAAGRLVLGEKAEKTFGRRNFMELFAVFSTPISYRVETTAGKPVGTLSQDFVDRLVPNVSSFLLGGKAWVPGEVHYNDKLIKAIPAPRGRQPTWGGFLPQFLGYEVSQKILGILRSKDDYKYLHDSARRSLAESRAEFADVLRSPAGGFQVGKGEILWWTFAGGRINSTLRYLLQALQPKLAASSDNFAVRVKRTSVTNLMRLIRQLRQDRTWSDEEVWQRVIEALPAYRLSKFQPFLPGHAQREMLTDYLLDTEGARRWITSVPLLSGTASTETTEEEAAIGDWSGLAHRLAEAEAAISVPEDAAEDPNLADNLGKDAEPLKQLVREWVLEAAVATAAQAVDQPEPATAGRWSALAELVRSGYTHERHRDLPSPQAWKPAKDEAGYVTQLIDLALTLARAPMHEEFGKTQYPPEDLDGLEDYLVVLFDLVERQERQKLGRVDRGNLARASAHLLEPFCAKLLAILEEKPFLELLLEKFKGKEHHIGLRLLLDTVHAKGLGNMGAKFFTLLSKKPPSTEGWDELDTFANALRDLYLLRNRFGHKAPKVSPAEARSAALHAIVVVLSLVEHNQAELAKIPDAHDEATD